MSTQIFSIKTSSTVRVDSDEPITKKEFSDLIKKVGFDISVILKPGEVGNCREFVDIGVNKNIYLEEVVDVMEVTK
jgi:hypothetical protein